MPSRDLQDLHPQVRRRALRLLEAATERGLAFIFTQTGRTQEEQVAFHAQGRKPLQDVNQLRAMAGLSAITEERNEKTITGVRTSVHQFGLAFDIALKTEAGGVHWDTKADINARGGPDYNELGEVGEALGLLWGGRFRSRDLVHFEWTGGLTLDELRAGRRPPDKQDDTEKKTENVRDLLTQAFEDEYPQKQEEETMNPAMIATAFALVRGVAGLNTRDKYEEKTGNPRPKRLARRSIGTIIIVISAIAGAVSGAPVSDAATAALTANFTQVFDTVTSSIPIMAAAWGSVVTLIGWFRRKKKGK